MAVPKEIREVERPKNTVVMAYGKNKDRYAVRMRNGAKYADGKTRPINGPIIGHIIDGKYVPCDDLRDAGTRRENPDLRDWADAVFCDALFSDMIPDLRKHYSEKDAMKLYCISLLRVIYPGIKDRGLQRAYQDSYLSVLHPDVALSRNTVCTFLGDIGRAASSVSAFMKDRAAEAGIDDHILIDGTLKSDESSVNSLSDFSRKAKTKGTRDISVIYAFDLEKMEPVASKCFPGNMLDVTAYDSFLEECGITKGIMVGDKGFPSSAASERFRSNPNLHYLNPLKRNSAYIKKYSLNDYDTVIEFSGRDITCRKAKTAGGKYLYAFRDRKKASQEEAGYISGERKKSGGSFDNEKYKEKRETFGTLLLESDLDMDLSVAYEAYSYRWEIELVMRFYKSACRFDETREHSDYSVIASEFIDFLSTVLTFRILRRFDELGLLEKYTYGQLMGRLQRAKKVRVGEGEWKLIQISPSDADMLRSLEILPKEEKKKRKVGRPKKNK